MEPISDSNGKDKEINEDRTTSPNLPEHGWKYIRLLKALKPMLLSHHPDCPNFDNHVIKIGKRRFCIGCFIGYPSGIIGVILIFLWQQVHPIPDLFLFLSGMSLLSLFLLSPLGLAEKKAVKILQKILVALGGSFLFWWIWTLPNPFLFTLLICAFSFGLILGALNAYHAYGIFKACKKCEHEGYWEECPGFEEINENLDERGLPRVFKFRTSPPPSEDPSSEE